MKNLIACICLLICLPGFAQPNQATHEKMEAMKIAYITTALDLTPAEAQLFWPIYNESEQKRKELRKARFADRKEAAHNFDTMTDQEAEQYIDREIDFKQKELDLHKERHLSLKKILSAKKIAKLYKAELDFQRKILQDLDGRPGRGK
jgi:hypothetical protein